MKMNCDAIRTILLFIEENINYDDKTYKHSGTLNQDQIVNSIELSELYTIGDLKYAIDLLLTTNYLDIVGEPKFLPDGSLSIVKIKGLTFDGANFLDNIRNENAWKAIKERGKAVGISSIKVLATSAATLGSAMLSDPNALNNFMEGTKNFLSMIK